MLKQIKKKAIQTISLVLCAALIYVSAPINGVAEWISGLSFAAHAADIVSGTCGENGRDVTWSLDLSTGTLTFRGTGGIRFYKIHNYLPWYPYEENIKTVDIQDGVTSIGNWNFSGCTNLMNIMIPDSVTHIGWGAFKNTAYYNDENNWEDDVLYIGHYLIDAKDSLSGSYTIVSGTTCISDCAFEGCSNLKSVTIPDGITTIDWLAFGNCTGLTSVTIPESVTIIGDDAFSGCTSLTTVTIPDSVTIIDTNAFSGCTSLSIAKIGNSVKSIGGHAFYNCVNLSRITIPASILNIDDYAFFNCSNLANVTIPDSVTSIGCLAFENTAYYNKESNWADGVLYIGNHLIKAKDNISGNYSIATGTKCIAKYAFVNCGALESILIPDSVTSIGDRAFIGCTSLKEIYVNDNNVVYCSDDCGVLYNKEQTSLLFYPAGNPRATFEIPNTVTDVETSAFEGCRNLVEIKIPDCVASIGWNAFLHTAYYDDEDNWIDGVLYLENHLIKAKESLSGSYVIVDGTKCIADSAFEGCRSLNAVKIPNSVTSIGNWAFSDCESIVSVKIPNSVMSIGDAAFSYCPRLVNVKISDGTMSIGDEAFSCCGSLMFIHIPASVTKIGRYCVYPQAQQESIYICTDTMNCYAKSYAEANWIQFRLCHGNHEDDTPAFYGNSDGIRAECDEGCFDEDAYLYVSMDSSVTDPLAEFGITICGASTVQKLYYIGVRNENGEYIQPKPGHKVTLRIPLIYDDFGNSVGNEDTYRIYHVDSETGRYESFRNSRNNLRIEDGYLIIEVDHFSPFVVAVEEEPTVSIRNNPNKAMLRYGETMVLTADTKNLPEGAKIAWETDSGCVTLKPSVDGATCEVTSKKNGTATVTVKIIDAGGNPIESDEKAISDRETIQSKAGFFDCLRAFFMRLFGIVMRRTQNVSYIV